MRVVMWSHLVLQEIAMREIMKSEMWELDSTVRRTLRRVSSPGFD